MQTITASEANRHFSEILRKAASGEKITILSRKRAVAEIGPVPRQAQGKCLIAKQELLARLNEQAPTSYRNWTREELYEEGG